MHPPMRQTFLSEDVTGSDLDGHAYVADEMGEDDFLEQLLHEDDEDAILVADYESAAADALQSDEDLAVA